VRFPRTAALAGWCREALGVAVFPAEMLPLGLEPYEQALARLDGLLWQCGQTAVEVLTTRLSLRPEVQAQMRAAKEPAAVLGRQLTYAVEDFTARALRRGDTVATGLPEPLARLPDPAPWPAEDEKPKWMDDERWAFCLHEREVMQQAREKAREAREQERKSHVNLSSRDTVGAGAAAKS